MRTGKDLAVANPMFFFGHDRELAEEAVAGDIVGIPNHGTLSVGDTLTEGATIKVTGHPELRARNHPPRAPHRSDQGQAAGQGAERSRRGGRGAGVPPHDRRRLDRGRRRASCSSKCCRRASSRNTTSPSRSRTSISRWRAGSAATTRRRSTSFITAQKLEFAEDKDGDPVYLAQSAWWLGRAQRDNPKVEFLATKRTALACEQHEHLWEEMHRPETIGFLGLGLMGHGMARNIVEKGFPLTVMAHRNRAPIDDLVGRGATEVKSVRESQNAVPSFSSASPARAKSKP